MLLEICVTFLGKAEHERRFWKDWNGKQKIVCWVDIERIIRKVVSWKRLLITKWGRINGTDLATDRISEWRLIHSLPATRTKHVVIKGMVSTIQYDCRRSTFCSDLDDDLVEDN